MELNIHPSQPQIILLTGWRGVGKTTFCQKLAVRARDAGWRVGGLLSPARIEGKNKTGIWVEDLASGQRRLLASNQQGELHGVQQGQWTFHPPTLAWSQAALKRALPCDLFILDELGPLEFDHHQGWALGFDLLASNDYRLALVVIRPEYIPSFQTRFPSVLEMDLQEGKQSEKLMDHFPPLQPLD